MKVRSMFKKFLDIKDAYDNVLWDILVYKLIQLKLPLSNSCIILIPLELFNSNLMTLINFTFKSLSQGYIL